MKSKKIIISVFSLLSLILILSFILYYFNPRLSYSYIKETDSYEIKKAYGYANTYVIPSTHKGKKVTVIGKRCFENSKAKNIIFEENSNIQIIETRAFYKANVRDIELPDSVSKIYEAAFAYSNIETFKTSFTSSYKNIAGSTFFEAKNLKNVDIKNLESIGTLAFYNNESLKELYLENETKLYTKCFVNCIFTLYTKKTNNYDYDYTYNSTITIIRANED